MSKLVSSILHRQLDNANEAIAEAFHSIMEKKLFEMKKMVSAKMYSEMNLSGFKPDYANIEDRRYHKQAWPMQPNYPNAHGAPKPNTNTTTVNKSPSKETTITKRPPNETVVSKNNVNEEEEQLDEARVKIVKARVRGGKVQRRKKVSNVPGMTIRGGKLTRMSPAERRRRKMGARKAKVKRKAKRTQMLMKRKRSLMRRRAMGL